MFNKKSMLTCLLAVGMSMPLIAQAGLDLTLVNNTNYDSTVIINHGACSTALPNGKGTTKAHSTNTVPGMLIKGACGAHQKDCKGDVYMTPHCNGGGEASVATATFNTATGETQIELTAYGKSSNYGIRTDSPFHVIMDGGPAVASK